jgi:serine protease
MKTIIFRLNCTGRKFAKIRSLRDGTFAPKMKNRAVLLLFYTCFLLSSPMHAQITPYQSGVFLVSLVEGANVDALTRRFDPTAHFEKVSDLLNICLLHSTLPEQDALNWLRRQPEVRVAQLNHLVENRAIPNDLYFPKQWHFVNSGTPNGVFNADMDADQAWDITTGGLTPAGDTIVVAVIDGGVDASHSDLLPNLWNNWAEIPGNGLDDDANGYIDDFRGWNVFSENDAIQGSNSAHGTPVAGIIGARGNNGQGVTGVNWTTKIMFVSAVGTEASILSAFDYVLRARQRYNTSWGEKGAFVVAANCSWGINYGDPSQSPLWCEAFDQLGQAGIISVAATANLPVNVDVVGDLPTTCPSNFLISATSLNKSDEKAENAAWGALNVDLGAYGQDVFTTSSGNEYGAFSGTSFAAPQVAGALGLLYAAPCPNLIALAKTDPASAAYWAKSLILGNVTPNPSLTGKTVTDGRLNLFQTLQNYENQCSDCPAPFALKTEAGTDTSVLLRWVVPPTAIAVNLRWRTFGLGPWKIQEAVSDSFLLSDLKGCTAYEFEMQSSCEGLWSAWSSPFIFETAGCCSAPTSVWVEASNSFNAKIGWEPIANNEGYRLRYSKHGSGFWTFYTSDTSFWVLQGLTACTEYDVQVQARCEDAFTGFSPLFTFLTKGCGACNELEYCAAKAASATEEWIAAVQIGSWSYGSGSGGSGYQGFNSILNDAPQLIAGSLIPVVVSPGFSGAVSKEYYRIFVDFNQDGDFEDNGELAFDPGFALEGVVEGVMEVPDFTLPGLTRMRVMMKYTNPNDNPPGPCVNFDYGQVEDYCAELIFDSVNTATQEKNAFLQMRVYPQPAMDWVVLETSSAENSMDCELLVMDLTGRSILNQITPVFHQGKFTLNISRLPSGLYVFQVRAGGRLFSGKILKG